MLGHEAVLDYLLGPDYRDARVQSWPLVDARSAMLVSAAYILGVPLGQRLMRHRKPFQLKGLSIAHNIFMLLLSLWMVVETLTQAYANFGWSKKFVPWANMTERGDTFSESGHRLATVLWVHYISKAYEFMDTAIMVLRKKNSQISFLHVYHHASTFFPCWWAGINYAPGGDVYFLCTLNSFVHVCMYAYYLASSLGIRVSQPLKKSITVLQMTQFGLANAQALYGVVWATWYRPRILIVLALVQSVIFMVLFGHFYSQAYGKKRAAGLAKRRPAEHLSAVSGKGSKQGDKENSSAAQNGFHKEPLLPDISAVSSATQAGFLESHPAAQNGFHTEQNGHYAGQNGDTAFQNGHHSEQNGWADPNGRSEHRSSDSSTVTSATQHTSHGSLSQAKQRRGEGVGA